MGKTEILKYSVGIDVSKKTLQVCMSQIDTLQTVTVKSTGSFDNDLSGFKVLLSWITKHRKNVLIPISITMEATGIYHESCAFFFHGKQMDVSVVLPNTSKKFMQSLNLKSKNDFIDSVGLAQMGAERNLAKWTPISPNVYQLRTLIRHRQTLTENLTRIQNQLEGLRFSGYPSVDVTASLTKIFEFLGDQCEALNKTMESVVKNDAVLFEQCQILSSIKGVGILTAATVIAETNGFLAFNNERQVVSYAGYDVIERQSGNKAAPTRISKKGNHHIRRILHMSSLSLINNKVEPFHGLWTRVFERTRIKMKAYVAVQRKLLTMLYTLAKKKEKFDPCFNPNWHTQKQEKADVTLRKAEAGSSLSALLEVTELCAA